MAEVITKETDRSQFSRLRDTQERCSALMPIGKTLGFVVERIEPGSAIVSIEANERHANVLGGTHGGVLFTIADTAMGLAHIALLAEGSASIEAKINFLRPVWHTRLRAEASVVHHGHTISVFECNLSDGAGRSVARASATMMRLNAEKAAGRNIVLAELQGDFGTSAAARGDGKVD